jgi:predicted O-linked N-acetylglucosamine transferase (SPINDLY family)
MMTEYTEANIYQNLDPISSHMEQQSLDRAIRFHQNQIFVEASKQYQLILQANPYHSEALYYSGVLEAQMGRLPQAVEFLERALNVSPTNAGYSLMLADIYHQLGQFHPAEIWYGRAVDLKPLEAEYRYKQAMNFFQQQKYVEALNGYRQLIAMHHSFDSTPPAEAMAEFYCQQGNALQALQQYKDAAESYAKSLELQSGRYEIYNNQGAALLSSNQSEQALKSYSTAIALDNSRPDAYYNRGLAFLARREFQAALNDLEQALFRLPDNSDILISKGNALKGLKQSTAALKCFETVTALQPDYVEVHYNSLLILMEQRQYQQALHKIEIIIKLLLSNSRRQNTLKPLWAETEKDVPELSLPEIYNQQGLAYKHLFKYQEAIAAYNMAIALDNTNVSALNNLAMVHTETSNHELAITALKKSLLIEPDSKLIFSHYLHNKLNICDWQDYEDDIKKLLTPATSGCQQILPFQAMVISDSPATLQGITNSWVQEYLPHPAETTQFDYPKHAKIRIGFFSADFRLHPVSLLTIDMFELFDRDQLETYAFSLGPETDDGMRMRLKAAFDKFIDIRNLTDDDVQTLVRNLQIDIAIDMGGFTAYNRLSLFANRLAPIQAAFLGYAGGTGIRNMDYIIADQVIIPETSRTYYCEKVAYLPSYQVNSTTRRFSSNSYSRKDFYLPEKNMVYCCFNNHYKFNPLVFKLWMEILSAVPDSVLWLPNNTTQINAKLQAAAEACDVDADRLVFAGKMPEITDHLSRLQLADLFLDTLPYNAHTSASDALWAGVPVLTRIGESFAGRVAASILTSLNLPELIAKSPQEYRQLAIEHGLNPALKQEIRNRLNRHRLQSRLFDIHSYTRDMEKLLQRIYQRQRQGLAPDHLPAEY